MKSRLSFPRSLLALFILLVAGASAALTLGRSQGVALVGRPLDVAIALTPDAGTTAANLCPEAEVFYGDLRVDGNRVSTQLEGAGATAMLRVRSSVPVDEPVVTVFLRVGCSDKVTRRYVLLSEQPAEAGNSMPFPAGTTARPATAAAAAAPLVSPAEPSGAGVPSGRGNARTRAPRARADASAATAAGTPAAPAAGTPTAPTAAAAAAPARAAPSARQPAAERPRGRERARLKLDPLDLAAERDPTLRSTGFLASEPDASPERRAQAAAMWQALNAKPEDVLRNNQRLQALETDVKSVRDAVNKNNVGLIELRGQLEEARSQRFSNPLVWALGALLLGALALAVWLWRRRPAGESGAAWWRGARAERDDRVESDLMSFDVKQRPTAVAGDSDVVDLDLNFTGSRMGNLSAGAAAAPAHGPRSGAMPLDSGPGDLHDFRESEPANLRATKAEELHDVQQQADFFVSLGEHDQAIEVLRAHIIADPETSAVAWLDLLEINHSLKRREDYEQVRDDFQRVFNAEVPSFEQYRQENAGLHSYQQALSRIVALWPSPKVLDVIEDSIFRKPGSKDGEAFGLEAYRELLMLHNIGKEVIEGHNNAASRFERTAAVRPADFSHTTMEPLSVSLDSRGTPRAPGEETMPNSPRFGLDINLDELPPSPQTNAAADDLHMLDFDLPHEVQGAPSRTKKPKA